MGHQDYVDLISLGQLKSQAHRKNQQSFPILNNTIIRTISDFIKKCLNTVPLKIFCRCIYVLFNSLQYSADSLVLQIFKCLVIFFSQTYCRYLMSFF